MTVTIVDTSRPVTGGVDTHLDLHVADALDGIGGLLGVEEFNTTVSGNKALLGWLRSFGTPMRVGVEGTGSDGAGLARYLRRAGVDVVEVAGQPPGRPAEGQDRLVHCGLRRR